MIQIKKRYKPVYKNFLRLRVNPLSNNKFFKFKVIIVKLKKKTIKKFEPIEKFNKKKWEIFLNLLKKKYKFYKRFKPYTFYSYNISKFASTGNSFKKKFRNNLLTKKTFNHMHGNLSKKYLKNRMTEIYNFKQSKNLIKLCSEFFESRLDTVLYRAKFSHSVRNAKQLLAHKHIKVNNKIEKNGSYILKQGDLISVNSNSISIIKNNFKKQFKERPDSILYPTPPNYLNINYNTLEIIFGDVKNFNFTISFNFKLDTNSLVTELYRH